MAETQVILFFLSVAFLFKYYFFRLAVLPMNINVKANSLREQIIVLLFTKIEDQSLHLVSDLISTSHILEKQSLLLVSTDCFLLSLYGNFTCFFN